MLVERIREGMMAAMRSGDTVAKGIYRVALGEIQSAEARTGDALTDEAAGGILRKLLKSNEESMAATPDAAQKEVLAREISLLKDLLPREWTPAEIQEALADVEDAIRGAKADGPAMGIAMKRLKALGAAVSGQDVSQAVRAIRA